MEATPSRKLRDYLAAAPAALMWLVAALLPPAAASRLGGWLLGHMGPHQRKHRHVIANLQRVLPDADADTVQRAARAVWRNFGSVLFEYPHLGRIARRHVAVSMPPGVQRLFDTGRPMMFITGHLGNWELLGNYLSRHSQGLVVIYSPRKNVVLERLIQRFRTSNGGEYLTKQQALRQLSNRNLNGKSLALLPDVRVDSGVALPLFGTPAHTTVSPPRLAVRLDYPLVPVRVKRLGSTRFELEFAEPLTADPASTGKQAAVEIMTQFNRLLETWISERPGEWLCTKRRWPRPCPAPEGAAGGVHLPRPRLE